MINVIPGRILHVDSMVRPSRSSTVLSIPLVPSSDFSPPTSRRHSFAVNPIESLKSKVSTFGRKPEEQNRNGNERGPGGAPRDETDASRRRSFDVALPRPEARVRFETAPREFPQDWQTVLGSQNGSLRNRSTNAYEKEGSRRKRISQLWPTSIGARCKFFRLVVVANPSLQRLASRSA